MSAMCNNITPASMHSLQFGSQSKQSSKQPF